MQSLRFTFVWQLIRCLRNNSVLLSVTLPTRSASTTQPYCHDTSSLHSLSCHFTLLIYFTASSICTEHFKSSSRNNMKSYLTARLHTQIGLDPVFCFCSAGMWLRMCVQIWSAFGLFNKSKHTHTDTLTPPR